MTSTDLNWLGKKFKERFTLSSPTSNCLGTVFPNDKSELQDLMAAAIQNKWRLHIVSSGKNWGFGNDQPCSLDRYLLIHLKNLNRILEFNEKLAYVVVEPGVTFEQLHLFLQQKTQGRLLIDAPGSSMQASVIGNLLERGHGQTPYSDHIEHACHFEILLGNGKTLKTGFGSLGSQIAPELQNLDKWGLGPSLDGLISQSNFGIVTQATVWLLPKPQNISLLQLGFPNSSLSTVVDHLVQMRLKKYLSTGPHLANVYFLLSRLFRLHQLTDQTHLSFEEACQIAKQNGISEWNANLVLYGTNEHVASIFKMVESELGPVVDSIKITSADQLKTAIEPLSDSQRFLEQISGLRGGTGISRIYWRKKSESKISGLYDADLEKDGTGVICNPIACPPTGEYLCQVRDILQSTCEKHETEPFSAAFLTRDRLFHIHNFLIFDLESAEQKMRHEKCAAEINRKIQEIGLAPHRLSSSMTLSDYQLDPAHLEILKVLKQHCDPEDLFIDRRYLPRS